MKHYWVYATRFGEHKVDLVKFHNKDSAGETYALLIKYARCDVRTGMIRKKMTEQEVTNYIKDHFPNCDVVIKE